MRMLSLEQKIVGALPFLRKMGCVADQVDEQTRAKIGRVMEICGDRIKVFSDILLYGTFFFRPPQYDLDLVEKRLHKESMPELVREFADILKQVVPFEARELEAAAREFCEAKGIKIGDLNHALRVAVTGVMVGPGMYDVLDVLGREETLRRLEQALALGGT
jgi:glutamyl/glutaminyl-tRNA synthetase